jgi:hypothetical protein
MESINESSCLEWGWSDHMEVFSEVLKMSITFDVAILLLRQYSGRLMTREVQDAPHNIFSSKKKTNINGP